MTGVENPRGLLAEAEMVRKAGRYAEAALIFSRARAAAKSVRDEGLAFTASVWLVECLMFQGYYKRSGLLLMEILARVPPSAPITERVHAYKGVFLHAFDTKPELKRLLHALNDLNRLADEIPVPTSDLSTNEGLLAMARGDWPTALHHFQIAWSSHSGPGYWNHHNAFLSAVQSLNLDRSADAMAWRKHLASSDPEVATSRRCLAELDARLALYSTDPDALLTCRENSNGPNIIEARVILALRRNSGESLDDPADLFHPARFRLRQGPDERSAHGLYDYRLAVVDYHLECLRFAAALPAIDDLYYRQPDVLPAAIRLADPSSFAARLQRFRRAWCRLERHAHWLDGLLECDWRTKEATSRLQRAEAIVASVVHTPGRRGL